MRSIRHLSENARSLICILLTLVGLGCQNYVKTWGGGQICPTIIKFQNKVENYFFQSLPLFALHQNNNCQGWSCKRKVPQKKFWRKNPRRGHICPPPPLGQLGLKINRKYTSPLNQFQSRRIFTRILPFLEEHPEV